MRFGIRTSVLILGTLLLALILSGAECLKPVEEAVKEKTGTIEGTVSDQDGNPIEGATVTTVPSTEEATTDASGSFSIEDVEPGDYVVKAEKEGFRPGKITVTVEEGKVATANIVLETGTPIGEPPSGTGGNNITFAIHPSLVDLKGNPTDKFSGNSLYMYVEMDTGATVEWWEEFIINPNSQLQQDPDTGRPFFPYYLQGMPDGWYYIYVEDLLVDPDTKEVQQFFFWGDAYTENKVEGGGEHEINVIVDQH
ncbi:MAG: carboxypeptidase-like regulatory domain-containing protein [bacterium]